MIKQLGKYSAKFNITMAGWNEPIYMEYEGALRAMKIEKIEVRLKNRDSFKDRDDVHFIYHVKIAGVGMVQFDTKDWSYLTKDFYLSPADFGNRDKLKMAQNIKREYPMIEWVSECFGLPTDEVGKIGVKGLYQCDVSYLMRWVWDGVKAVSVAVELPDVVYYEYKRGWYFAEPCNFPTDSYPTKEDCEMANRIKIVEFADDVENDVEDDLRRHIRTEVMRTFCSWLTASDIESVATAIADEVVEDVKVCSDYPNYNDSDVRLAIQRAVMGRVIGE